MTIALPVEPGLVAIFAHAVGDLDDLWNNQIGVTPGTPITTPLTFVRAVADHFDTNGELRMWPGAEPTPEGGGPDRFHAEQHFEYLRPLRAGETLTATTRPGRTWSRAGRAGRLEFAETVTDFCDATGELVVHTRKVGVRVAKDDR